MKKHYVLPCLLLLVFQFCSCASRPRSAYELGPELQPEWHYEKDVIHLSFKADPQLNLDDGMPHTLHVCVYQLIDPNAFNQLANDNDGLYNLLECTLFDASVAASKSLIVRPGKDRFLSVDRAEGAKYVAIIAGYYFVQKERILRLLEIPVMIKRKGFMWHTRYAKPAPLNLEITLGSQQIQEVHPIEGD